MALGILTLSTAMAATCAFVTALNGAGLLHVFGAYVTTGVLCSLAFAAALCLDLSDDPGRKRRR